MRYSLSSYVEGLSRKDYGLLVGDFLDDFYAEPDLIECYNSVEREPVFGDDYSVQDRARIAGMVNFLSNRKGFKSPKWVFKKEYYLEEPYFSANAKGRLRICLIAETPIEFRARNMFISRNSFDRA